jgi:hypothetical protein
MKFGGCGRNLAAQFELGKIAPAKNGAIQRIFDDQLILL